MKKGVIIPAKNRPIETLAQFSSWPLPLESLGIGHYLWPRGERSQKWGVSKIFWGSLRVEWAAKIFSVKSHLTPLPPVINNDRSLRMISTTLYRSLTISQAHWVLIRNFKILSHATFPGAPSHGAVRTWVEGSKTRGDRALAEASNLLGYLYKL